ncbi:hypothetical protein KIH87_12535 [Paraneptunicella aestuarii]|uniref:hypothetical protein n=1 Tax=Paraneptunicella aestuarii TaxID=2831148 RepID=UPI001E5C4BD9|nr:hypothetical protein [Paraneptunicella aestuarii]UAA37538.1 hypothetical protein KIH87_12535 [Paraneptunicella aestuarii]
MSELIQAQKKALELTKEIGESQKDDPVYELMPVPGLRIDNFDLSLKFIIDDDDGEEEPTETEQPRNAALEAAKKHTIIRTLISQTGSSLFSRSDVKPLVTKNKVDARELSALRSSVNQTLIAATNHETAVFNETQAQNEIIKLISGSKLKGARDIAVMRKAVKEQLDNYKSELQTETTPKVVTKRSNLIVDKKRLANVNPELISTINMSLSLDEYEWVDDENGNPKLRSAG